MPRRLASSNASRSSKGSKAPSKPAKDPEDQDAVVEGLSLDEETDEQEDEDADAPRIAQWVDEDDLNGDSDSGLEEGPSKNPLCSYCIPGISVYIYHQFQDLSELSMGALRRAQQALSHTAESDSDSESEASSESESEEDSDNAHPQEKEWSIKPRPDIGKRQNKHAPTEVSSKKPVTRRRTIVQVQAPQARDPRFLTMSGEFSAEKYRNNYSFLTDAHKTELQTLRENLKRARKLLASSPRDLRPEREAEVQRLELAVKRAESSVNRDRREEVEQKALDRVSKEEREQRKAGKGSWHLKNSAKKELLLKARYDALAESGGQTAVKKAIEKRRKKIGQKEKKSRPFSKGEEQSGKRPNVNDGGGPAKRRKLW
ncbi:hypothetical protein D9758_000320 [Tetrapyrgos nigripes]|uniref:rRNA biogenesis protein RRP36 n=1 Tax=Tetrapyrgos nigripes TaxID=182062 RepID=A0A8H5H0T5_9AGAR|nr:hypothetical protein D9758_000320 [Tetrapyrgos nigripes]